MTAPASESSGAGSIHHLHAHQFDDLVPRALANVELRGALAKATNTIRNRRAIALEGVDDLQELRSRAKAIKTEALAHLDEHLEAFERHATANGIKVHWAADAKTARSIVLDIARMNKVELAVKAKSMVSEEIGLNDALIDAGIVPVETDLGEWIVQLAEEPPSHILAPAIHKRRREIRDLLARVLGRPMPDDATGLTEVARNELRERFAQADLGISGANFLVAETGSFLLIENEGNIRLTTSLPRIHVAVAGIEKIVPRLEDLGPLVRIITRSATGQPISSYQTLVTGPKTNLEDDGPEEIHLILLDNGRSKLLEDDLTAETLRCIRCSACLNVCPVYRQIGGHAYGSVYPGPIGAIFTPLIAGMHAASQLPGASSLCGACREVCPVDIDIPGVLLHLRHRAAEGDRSTGDRPMSDPRTMEKNRAMRRGFRLWRWAMGSSRRFQMFGAIGRLVATVVSRVPSLARHAGPLAGWTDGRTVPRSPGRSFRSGKMARRLRPEGPGRA
jgi:L-lactate dehydrogenase complex protein LldF